MTDYTDKINSLANDVIPALKADRDNYIDSIISAAQEEDVGRIRALFGPLSSSVVMVDGITEVMKDLQSESVVDAPVDAAPVEQVTPTADQCACTAQDNTAQTVDNIQPADPSAAAPASDPSAPVNDAPSPTQDATAAPAPTCDGSAAVTDANVDPNTPAQ